jgi:hypothetical protein
MGSAATAPPGVPKNRIPMNAAARAEHKICPFFIVSLLSMVPGLGLMVPADADSEFITLTNSMQVFLSIKM